MQEHEKAYAKKLVIANSLEELLKAKPLAKITVAELMRRAQMTRQMFYHYFLDINDLVYWMHLRDNLQYTNQFFASKNFVDAFQSTLSVMSQRKTFYRNIVTTEGPNSFAESFFEQMMENTVQHIGSQRIDEEIDFSMHLYWRGVTHVIVAWVKGDMKQSPEELAKRFYQNLPSMLLRFYE